MCNVKLGLRSVTVSEMTYDDDVVLAVRLLARCQSEVDLAVMLKGNVGIDEGEAANDDGEDDGGKGDGKDALAALMVSTCHRGG